MKPRHENFLRTQLMVSPGVDGYTKTRNHRKILQNARKTTENQRNTKSEVGYKISGGPSFTFSLQEGTIRPSSSSR